MYYKDIIPLNDLKKYASTMNHRAQEVNAKGIISPEILREVILDSRGKCAWCDRNLVNQDFEIDHITALVNGGDNTARNLALTCISCNRRKSEKHPAKFALEIVAETGIQTTFTQSILDQHNIKPQQQQSLFDDADNTLTDESSTWTYTPPEN